VIVPLLALVAAAAPAGLPGVWEGTIGDLPVRACFTGRESYAFGAYYYLSRRQLIALNEVEGSASTFFEGNGAMADQPRWLVESAQDDRLAGRWTQGTRTLPLRLRRVARQEGEDSPCGSMAFHQPRLEGVRIVRTRASGEGMAYTKLALDHGGRFDVTVESFALDGDGAASRQINAALARGLTEDPPEWLGCIRDSLSNGGYEGSFAEILAPAMVSRRWLSVSHHWDGFCGGAHPDSSNTYRLFDLETGREADLYDWLNERAVRREGPRGTGEESKTLTPALRKAILAGWRAEAGECEEVVRAADYWDIGLTRQGITFAPSLPHVVQACGEDFTLSFARLRPFLSAEGEANARALQAEPARTANN
jgi:hypothetical protein